jgi:hypothetical protein
MLPRPALEGIARNQQVISPVTSSPMEICWVLLFLKPTGLGLTDTGRYILQSIDREFVPVAWNLQTLDDQCQSKI